MTHRPSSSNSLLARKSGRPVVLDRGRCVTMLTMSRLHALENLPQLVTHLPKLMVDLLAEGLVFLFKAANLLL